MSPVEIQILLHYYAIPKDYEDEHEMHSAQSDAIAGFLGSSKLLQARETQDRPKYELTNRGVAYVEALTSLPLPEIRWIIPESANG